MKNIDFIIVGERRCGTTTLYNLLLTHPEIVLPTSSDINYFIETPIANSKKFIPGNFDESSYWEDHSQEGLLDIFDDKKQGILGFKAPDTFFYKKAHARLKKLVPTSTKFIVILREPTSRALSHYWLDYAKGREPLSMEKAFNKEQERMEKSDYAKDHYSYKSRGFYHDNLKEWYKTFSKESTLVLILDDLKSQPEKEWKKIQAFLGVTKVPFQQVPKSNKNIAMIPRSSLASWKSLLVKYERLVFKFTGSLNLSNEEKIKWRKTLRYPFFKPIDTYNNNPSLRHNLLTAYLSDIEKLETLLNKDLNKWKSLN